MDVIGTTQVRGSMERVRQVLAGQRPELLDRWDRQLRAASDAGFALDADTAAVLPQLLEALDRALERRFQAVPASTAGAAAEASRAALQCSLLGDFVFDSALERLPEMSLLEQRLLGGALAHAAVEVLVRLAVERENDRRRRDGARLAPLRSGIEDALLDEILAAGGLRFSRFKLAPVLAAAHSAANDLGAGEKRVQVVLKRPHTLLSVSADPRLVRPAVRGLVRAALEVARPGTVVEVGADRSRDRARVEVTVQDCRKLPGNRLTDLPALSFARRAARAHGGSLVTHVSPGEGCEIRFELPALRAWSRCPSSAR